MATILFIITITVMMLSLVFFPKIHIFKRKFQTHWIIILIGALLSIVFGFVDLNTLKDMMFADSSMNPVKLIVLFIFLTILSLFLDEVGFFKWLAYKLINKIGSKQIYIFISVYLLASVLTVFTSNDIIILTLTPFLIYFCKNTKIKPYAYLFGVLTAANTWSLLLIIGNPTNIYLASVYEIGFMEYFKVMALPGLVAGFSGLGMIYLIFRNQLNQKMEKVEGFVELKEPVLVGIALAHLIVCIILMALSNVISLEMWLITVIMALSLTLIAIIYLKIKKIKLTAVTNTYKKAPWNFIPMILSMFVLIVSLTESGVTTHLANFLNDLDPIWGYGISSHFASNLMNNQSMSMLFAEILRPNIADPVALERLYASIIGSNTGVLLTPFGALAGLMWFELLKKHNIEISMKKYITTLFMVGFVVLGLTLLTLKFVI
ncbi:SLC13 family permease [Acholeplasma hippikon]|uniref:Arsenic efflux pump protein n=1 Tax=Acholeplasma hippikon TaxID=264636 RepID=A0A449BII0_9MOLU|nr:SLC13 family permease [Acholeplasma hippikon]VEU82271.1 Arsenic efflux pump protein [Acholeplasma hippikon]